MSVQDLKHLLVSRLLESLNQRQLRHFFLTDLNMLRDVSHAEADKMLRAVSGLKQGVNMV